MSKLKELTWENHQKAERKVIARKLLKGMEPREYHRFLYNQYVQYAALESFAKDRGILEGIENICRAPGFRADMEELESEHDIERVPELLCDVVPEYVRYVSGLDDEGLLSHIYVKHFGELHGGQMIKKRAPGSGTCYDFIDPEKLISDVRERLHDGMAPEANTCFEYAMKLFEELEQ